MTLKRPQWMQAGGGDPDIQYSALDDRALLSALITSEGVIPSTALRVTQRAAGLNFSVDVAVGWCVIQGDDVASQGKYLCESTAVVNVTIPGPPVSGTLVHRVIARVKDKLHNGTWSTYEWTIEVLPDVGGGTPALPNSAITLALVSVPAAASFVTDGIISNQRANAQSVPGRPYVLATVADLPTIGLPGDRYQITALAPIEYVWDGSAWRMDASAARIYKDRSVDATGRTATTLSADDQLSVTLLPGVTYRGTLVLPYTADAAGDFRWKLIPPNNGTFVGSALQIPAASTGASGPVTLDKLDEGSSPIGGGSGATQMTVTVQVKLWSGDGGTCAVYWCRDGATGTTVLLKDAFMDLIPVGT